MNKVQQERFSKLLNQVGLAGGVDHLSVGNSFNKKQRPMAIDHSMLTLRMYSVFIKGITLGSSLLWSKR